MWKIITMKKSSLHFLFCFFYWAVEKEIRGSRFGAIELFALMIVFFSFVFSNRQHLVFYYLCYILITRICRLTKKAIWKIQQYSRGFGGLFFFPPPHPINAVGYGVDYGMENKNRAHRDVTISR